MVARLPLLAGKPAAGVERCWVAETPYEKIRSQGPSTLFAHELLAIALARAAEDIEFTLSDARDLLHQVGGLRGIGSIDSERLRALGMTDAFEQARFAALLELGRRIDSAGRGERLDVCQPGDVAKLFPGLRDERKEHFCAVLLDTKNQILKTCTIHVGTVSASIVGVREFFREAVREGATSVIAVHNHPSGDPTPSKEDFEVTRILVDAGRLLDIPLLDHVIIGENDFRSMQQLGAIG
jgi:DNA repair protein RadC